MKICLIFALVKVKLMKKFYKKIFRQKKVFDRLLKIIQTENNDKNKLEFALLALKYATNKNCGYFCCSYLEKFFIDYAKTLKLEKYTSNFEVNSFLHVLTTGYETGGHTRVVERWIKNAPKDQKHSVVVLEPNEEKLVVLKENVKENKGQFIAFEEDSIENNALKLRKIAQNYQYIVLHIHMHDPTALLAFGVDEFKRPVIFYNHASHMFWVGKYISDLCLDLVQNDEITFKRRNIKNTFYMGIPTDLVKYDNYSKKELRKKLNIPINKKIIISAGNPLKYEPFDKDVFGDILLKLTDENTMCYLIGPSLKEKRWKKLSKKSKGNIIPLGCIDFKNGYLDYIKCADLYLDSYPFLGWTALIDSIGLKIPAISLKTVISQQDFFVYTKGFVKNQTEYLKLAKSILSNEEFSKKIANEEYNFLQNYQSLDSWLRRQQNMLKNIPSEHSVNYEFSETDYNVVDEYVVQVNVLTDSSFCKRKNNFIIIKYIFKIFFYRYIFKNNKKEIKYLIKL